MKRTKAPLEILLEFLTREERGESPDPEEVLARYPSQRRVLEGLFAVHRLLQAARRGPGIPRR